MEKTEYIPNFKAEKEKDKCDKRGYEKNIRKLIEIIRKNDITLLDEIYSDKKQRGYLENTIKTLQANKGESIMEKYIREQHFSGFTYCDIIYPDITKQMLRKLVVYSIEDINYQGRNDKTILMELLYSVNEREVMMILDLKNLDINKQCENGVTALMSLSHSKNESLIDELFSHDPEVDLKDIHGRTAIIYACYENNTYLVKKILECNPDLSIKYDRFFCGKKFNPGITVIEYESKKGINMNKYIYEMLINYRRVPDSLKNIVINILKKEENKNEMKKLLDLSGEKTFSMLTKLTNRKLNRDRTLKLYGKKNLVKKRKK